VAVNGDHVYKKNNSDGGGARSIGASSHETKFIGNTRVRRVLATGRYSRQQLIHAIFIGPKRLNYRLLFLLLFPLLLFTAESIHNIMYYCYC
jgi:hypothetical protein